MPLESRLTKAAKRKTSRFSKAWAKVEKPLHKSSRPELYRNHAEEQWCAKQWQISAQRPRFRTLDENYVRTLPFTPKSDCASLASTKSGENSMSGHSKWSSIKHK